MTVVVLMGAAVVVAITGLLGARETLPSNIRTAWLSVERDSQFDVVGCIFGPPTGAARGIQIVLLCLLFGGPPSAGAAAFLRRARSWTWTGPWANVFLAGFVFQLSSLAFTAFLLIVLLAIAPAPWSTDRFDVLLTGEALVLSIVCSIWGLRWWRALQLQVPHEDTVLGRL